MAVAVVKHPSEKVVLEDKSELAEVMPLVLRWPPGLNPMKDADLEILGSENAELRIERTETGELIIMPPASSDTGSLNAEIGRQLGNWVVADKRGRYFDSSSGFRLPSSAIRSPDAAWVERSRIEAIPPEERKPFLPLCPDFVAELRSPSDRLSVVREKMQEYIRNGARLGVLFDPRRKEVTLYRPGQTSQMLSEPQEVDCTPEMPGLVFDVAAIFGAAD